MERQGVGVRKTQEPKVWTPCPHLCTYVLLSTPSRTPSEDS